MTTESSSCSRPGSPTGPSRDTTSSPSDGIQPQNNTDKDNDQESPQVATGDSALNSSSSLPHGSPLIDPGHELHDCNSNGSTSSSDNEYIEPRKRICLAYSSSSSSLPINNTTPLSPTTNIITATTQNTFGPKLLRPEERCLSSSSSSCLSINHCQPNQSPHQEHNRNHHHNNNNHHSKHQSDKRYKSFLIDDILSQTFGKPKPKSLTGRPDPGRHSENKTRDSNNNSNNSNKNNSTKLTADCRIVRPWDISSNTNVNNNKRPNSVDEDTRSEKSTTDERSDVGSIGSPSNFGQNQSSPLDALFQLTQKAFESGSKINDSSGDNVMFNNRQTPKKKRKSRTAFTNHQIFELEKRFLYQKYLSPADRDELASSLSLTGAQVITWFQNRRAKLKRDMEELKKDMETAKMAHFQKGIYESIQDLSLLKSPEMRAALQLRKSP